MTDYKLVDGKYVKNKPIPDELIIDRKPAKIHELLANAGKQKRHEYAPSCYDEDDKLIDDGITLDDEKSYWESFVDHKQSLELERRLAIVEAEGYEEGDEEFPEMEDEDD